MTLRFLRNIKIPFFHSKLSELRRLPRRYFAKHKLKTPAAASIGCNTVTTGIAALAESLADLL
jgi:hypothetical protein